MHKNPPSQPPNLPSAEALARIDLLKAIETATKLQRGSQYTLQHTLRERASTYTNDLTGDLITLPPGGLFTGRPKSWRARYMVESDTLASHLEATCRKLGLPDPKIVPTTIGAWISNDTIDAMRAHANAKWADNPQQFATMFAFTLDQVARQPHAAGRG